MSRKKAESAPIRKEGAQESSSPIAGEEKQARPTDMFLFERQEKMLAYINKVAKVSVRELSELFNMSLVTIRSDIKTLARRGLIIRTHGGALSAQRGTNAEIPSKIRAIQNVPAKQMIAQVAAKLIEDDDIIILDSGSTTYEIAQRISARNVTVITNDLKIGTLLAERGDVSLIVTGGILLPSVYSLIGSDATAFLKRVKAHKLFLGCDAIDFEWGISNRTIQEVAIKQTMMEAARFKIAVADHSKFDKQVFARFCDLTDIDLLITDQLPPQRAEQLSQLGVRYTIASQDPATASPTGS